MVAVLCMLYLLLRVGIESSPLQFLVAGCVALAVDVFVFQLISL